MPKMNIKIHEASFNKDLEDRTASMQAFKSFIDTANKQYTIIVADRFSRVASVLKDYVDSRTELIQKQGLVYIPCVNEYDVKDIVEDLKSNKMDYCVCTQHFEIAP